MITFERTSAADQLRGIKAVEASLSTLTTDAQFVILAKAMQPYLSGRSDQVRELVATLDPIDARFRNATKARRVIAAWINEDDVDPANVQQWLTAISLALS